MKGRTARRFFISGDRLTAMGSISGLRRPLTTASILSVMSHAKALLVCSTFTGHTACYGRGRHFLRILLNEILIHRTRCVRTTGLFTRSAICPSPIFPAGRSTGVCGGVAVVSTCRRGAVARSRTAVRSIIMTYGH